MSINFPKPHHGSAAEFQVSGFPFVTGSAFDEVGTSIPVRVTFPYVTQFIQVTNIGSGILYVGFTENGVKGTETEHRFQIFKDATSERTTPVIPVKCKELYFLCGTSGRTTGFQVIAGLTNVREFPVLTGSNGFEGVG